MLKRNFVVDELEEEIYDEEPGTGLSLAEVIDIITTSLNENILWLLMPIILLSSLYLKEQFQFTDFNIATKQAVEILHGSEDDIDIMQGLVKVSNSTSLRYTYNGETIRLYNGKFHIELEKKNLK